MSKIHAASRPGAALPAGLVCLSVVCLAAGGILAGAQHGLLRVLYGGGGFAAYVYFFARALDALGLPGPDAP